MKLKLKNNTYVDLSDKDIYKYNGVIRSLVPYQYGQYDRDSLFIMKYIVDVPTIKGFAMQYVDNNKTYWAYFSKKTLAKKGNLVPGFPTDKFRGKEVVTIKVHEQDTEPRQTPSAVE